MTLPGACLPPNLTNLERPFKTMNKTIFASKDVLPSKQSHVNQLRFDSTSEDDTISTDENESDEFLPPNKDLESPLQTSTKALLASKELSSYKPSAIAMNPLRLDSTSEDDSESDESVDDFLKYVPSKKNLESPLQTSTKALLASKELSSYKSSAVAINPLRLDSTSEDDSEGDATLVNEDNSIIGSPDIESQKNKVLKKKTEENLPTTGKISAGEEVYLVHKGIDIFKAKCQEWEPDTTVHGHILAADERRFLITKLLEKSNTWHGFDLDRTTVGSYVKWKVKNVRKRNKRKLSVLGTEATYATPLAGKKRKREPEKWKVNVKKQKVNSGEPYNFVNKRGKSRGKVTRKEGKKMGPACNETCNFQCSENISPEERLKIHQNFWSLNDVSLQRAFILSTVSKIQKEDELEKKQKVEKRGQEIKHARIHLILPMTGVILEK